MCASLSLASRPSYACCSPEKTAGAATAAWPPAYAKPSAPGAGARRAQRGVARDTDGPRICLSARAGASRLAIAAGADFIKTSTGKIHPAATMETTLVMFEAIREHYLDTGVQVGMKPAGGIRTAKQALHYLVLLAETLGSDWMTPERFRFGASSLVNDLLRQIARREDGYYQSPRRFSVD